MLPPVPARRIERPHLPSILNDLPVDDEELDNQDEIEKYQTTHFGPVVDILLFWKEQQSLLPGLATLAQRVLSLPSSTSCEERNFSSLKYIIDDKRTRLNPQVVSDMFVYRSLSKLE